MATSGFYGADQALLHHVEFGGLAAQAGNHLIGVLRQAGLRGGTVVDLGCGSGILARVVTEAGYDAYGIDISPDMVELADKEAPLADFHRASILDASIPQAVAVTATGEVLNHAADRRTGQGALREIIRRAAEALVPGGIFLFDVSTPGQSGNRHWYDRDEWAMHTDAREDRQHQVLDRHITIFRRTGADAFRRTDERHVLRLFTPATVLLELTAAGLTCEQLDGYPSDLPVTPRRGWTVFQARKPA